MEHPRPEPDRPDLEERRSLPPAGLLDALDTPAVLVDTRCQVIGINHHLARLLPDTASGWLGRDFLTAIAGWRDMLDPADAVLDFIGRTLALPRQADRIRFTYKSGGRLCLELHTAPVLGARGELGGCLYLLRDVTVETRQLETLAELDTMVYTISHDLKNPVSVIQGVADLMAAHFRPYLDRDGQEFIQMVREESAKMLTLIEDILHLSRLRQGRLDRTEVDTLGLVNGIVAEFQHIYRDIPTVFIIDESLPRVSAQASLLTQVFKNLISNAIKYSDPAKVRAQVDIGYWFHDGYHNFTIRDNGLGMTSNEQARVFDMFYRIGEKDIEGSGLGTTILKRIVEAHGGRVWVESRKGVGSTFGFSLPARPSDPKPDHG